MRTIARRKENSSLDFLHEATLGMSFTFASLMYASWRFVQANLSEDVLGQLPVVEVGQSRFGDFKYFATLK